MQITLATPSDIPSLCTLLHLLFSQEVEFTPDAVAQSRGLALIINNPDTGHILLAREGDTVAGMVNLLYTVSTALGARVGLLEDMMVAPAFRNSGIGSQLLQHAIAHARQQGCQRITLLSDRNNEAAHRFYQRSGFTLSSMIPLRLSLQD